MAKCFFLIGLPACGKSTYTKKVLQPTFENGVYAYVSSDHYIELEAQARGLTYDEVFAETISSAEQNANIVFENAIANDLDIVIDRTNLTAKSRNKFASRLPSSYERVAIVFTPPKTDEEKAEWRQRLASRPGKTIPAHVLDDMEKNFRLPALDETFDVVIHHNTFLNSEKVPA